MKLSNERALSTEKYVKLPQSFHRSTLSIHFYIAQSFPHPFLRLPCLADLRILNVSMLKEIIALVWDYAYGTRK